MTQHRHYTLASCEPCSS